MYLRKNDIVRVISGNDQGKEGRIIKVWPKENKVLVQGVNLRWKHLRRSAEYPHGARLQKESPLSSSNVMLVCSNCNKPTRINYTVTSSGLKQRICKKCKQPIAES